MRVMPWRRTRRARERFIRWLDGHVVLARRLPHPRFRRIDTISARNHVHHFRLTSPADIDEDFRAWLREAYAVGKQEHLRRSE